MKKYQAEVERQMLENEQEVIDKIKKTYEQALKDVDAKLKKLYDDIDKLVKEQPENETLIRSKIYQKNYQEQIRKQITSNLDALKDSSVKNIEDYMAKMYEDGYLSTFYELQKEGVAVTAPINQELLVEAVTFNTADIPLSKRVYDNVELAKKRVLGEVTRGISSAMTVHEIARNIENVMKVSMKKANILAQNEGARVRLKATMDSAYVARSKGADVVKQWDATLDSKTRPVHRELDQQVAELDEPFKYSGGEVMQPKEFGIAALDINCRCALLILPRWDVQDTYKRRDNISKNLVEAKNYADWKERYHAELDEIANYSSSKARKTLSASKSEVKEADNDVAVVLGKLFRDYKPSPLVKGDVSECRIKVTSNSNGTLKYEPVISNVATPPKGNNKDIGNNALANSIHERTHDLINQMAMERAGIKDLNNVTVIQNQLFKENKEQITQGVYIHCFTDESFEEILEEVEREISKRAIYSGEEFICESMVDFLGSENPSNLSKKVYNYLKEKWKK